MNMPVILFVKKRNKNISPAEININGTMCAVKSFRLSLSLTPYVDGERRSIKETLSRIRFSLISKGKAQIFYIEKDGAIIHSSMLVPKCRKFPFLNEHDYEIGPCFTDEKFRGMGIYPTVLNYICSNIGTDDSSFYMIISPENISSIRGVEKVGFERRGNTKTTFSKKYILA